MKNYSKETSQIIHITTNLYNIWMQYETQAIDFGQMVQQYLTESDKLPGTDKEITLDWLLDNRYNFRTGSGGMKAAILDVDNALSYLASHGISLDEGFELGQFLSTWRNTFKNI